jgi:curved DNA-binding protein
VTLRRGGADGGPGRTDTYDVRIPAGVREGQRIRLAGQGGPGSGGGAAGDLYMNVRLARHPEFAVDGSDLHCDVDLAPWEAVLGVSVRIPALDGPVTLRIPAGTAAGRQFRLRGLGLPRGEGGRGDLHATIRIQLPVTATDAERSLWEQLARVSPFRPRGANGE